MNVEPSEILLSKAAKTAEALRSKAAKTAEVLIIVAAKSAELLRNATARSAEGLRRDAARASELLLTAAAKAAAALRSDAAEAAELVLGAAAKAAVTATDTEDATALLSEADENAKAMLNEAAEVARSLLTAAARTAEALLDDAAESADQSNRSAFKIALAVLRNRAEAALEEPITEPVDMVPDLDSKRLLHELQVHQLELEMQFEELLNSSAQMEKQKEYYADFYEFSPTGFISFDRNGAIIQTNAACAQLLGREPSRLVGARFSFFLNVLERPAFNSFLQQIFERGTMQACSVSLEGKDPALIFVQIMATLSSDKQLCQAVLTDLTERKRAENELQKSEERYRHLVESSNDWIWETDKNGIYTYASPNVRELLGYEPAEIIGKSPFELMLPEEAKRVEPLFGAIASEQKTFRGLENVNQRKDGQLVIFETNGAPLFAASGEFIGYYGMDRDITERKRSRDLLQESISLKDSLIQTIPFPMDIISKEGKVLFTSSLMQMAIGRQGVGELCWTLYKDDNQKCAGCPLEQPIQVGKTFSIECPGVLGGRVYEIFHTGMIYQGQEALMEVFLDITERKKLGEQLRESQKMEAVGQLIVSKVL